MSQNESIKNLDAGFYWSVAPGERSTIVEKRNGEDFLRATSGSCRWWLHKGEQFHGPLQPPVATTEVLSGEK